MTRAVLFTVFACIVFAGIESAADAAGPDWEVDSGGSHELHGTTHDEHHESDDDSHHDDHFCHCNAHGVALAPVDMVPATHALHVSHLRYDDHFTSLVAPPLLRPPNI